MVTFDHGLAQAGVWESLADTAATFSLDCRAPQSSASSTSPVCANWNNPVEQLKRDNRLISEESYLASLADERAKNDQCALNFINEKLSGKDFETYAANFETQVQLLSENILAAGQAQHKMSRLADQLKNTTRKDPVKVESLRSQLEELRKTAKAHLAAAAAIENSIPAGEQKEIKDFVKKNVQELLNGKTSLAALNDSKPIQPGKINSEKFRKDLRAVLEKSKQSVQSDIDVLNKGAKTCGKSLDRVTRESLAQDRDLIEGFMVRNPSLKNNVADIACGVDSKYGKGAEIRDQTLMYGSVALTAASLGWGLVMRGTAIAANTISTPARVLAARGLLTARSARILSSSAMGLDSVSGLKEVDSQCFQNQRLAKTKTSRQADRCQNYSLEALEEDQCVLAGSLTVLGVGLGTPAAQRLIGRIASKFKSGTVSPASPPVSQQVAAPPAPPPRVVKDTPGVRRSVEHLEENQRLMDNYLDDQLKQRQIHSAAFAEGDKIDAETVNRLYKQAEADFKSISEIEPGSSIQKALKNGESLDDVLEKKDIPDHLKRYFDPKTGEFKFAPDKPISLAVENGSSKLKAVRIYYMGEETTTGILRDYTKVLKEIPGMELWVQTNKFSKEALIAELETFPKDVRKRIKVIEIDEKFAKDMDFDELGQGVWAQDGSKPIAVKKNEQPKTLLRVESNMVENREFHQNLTTEFGKAGQVTPVDSSLYFEGGNVIVGEKNVFVGSDIIKTTRRGLGISQKETLAAYEAQFGKPVIEVGTNVEAPNHKALSQHAFHIDLTMSVAKNLKGSGEVVLVQSPSKMLEAAFNWPPIKTMNTLEYNNRIKQALVELQNRVKSTGVPLNKQEKDFVSMLMSRSQLDMITEEAKLTSIANHLQSKGYKVQRIPGTTASEVDGANLNIFNYTNVVLSGRKAVVPRLGIKKLDDAAKKTYEDLGYDVIQVDSSKETFCLQGGIRCVSETYRKPVYEPPAPTKGH
jgi:hypothetical protein